MARKPARSEYVRPENIQLGDLIFVKFKEDSQGLAKTVTARVAKREHEGIERVLLTAQGGEIFRWAPGHAAPVVLLQDRPIAETLERMSGEVWQF